jgi:hypothetical protein
MPRKNAAKLRRESERRNRSKKARDTQTLSPSKTQQFSYSSRKRKA